MCRFGKPDIDLFASMLNHKLGKYISFAPYPEAMAVENEAEAFVVATFWTTQKLVATTASSDCGFSHSTSSNTQNIVSAQ